MTSSLPDPGAGAGPEPTRLTVRSPEDLLALAPVVLGFHPSESLVLLTFGIERQFHARVDLPGTAVEAREAGRMLHRAVTHHRVPTVALLAYAADAAAARVPLRRTVRRFRRAGVGVMDALVTDGLAWWSLLDPAAPGPDGRPGTPYDVSLHPFRVESVVHGRVLLRDREAVAAQVAPDPVAVAATGAVIETLPARDPIVERTWVRRTVRRHLTSGQRLSTQDLARLVVALTGPRAREAAWLSLERDPARAGLSLWCDVLIRSPASHRAAPAALAAWAAWLGGDGALAWCALDRCLEDAPDYPLATMLAELLTAAVAPDLWPDLVAALGPDVAAT